MVDALVMGAFLVVGWGLAIWAIRRKQRYFATSFELDPATGTASGVPDQGRDAHSSSASHAGHGSHWSGHSGGGFHGGFDAGHHGGGFDGGGFHGGGHH
ncbi:MAG TPA: hypothetical protein VMI54_02875 [Polyangiaceae bacterium]|nr:hypothetical protein [Polyangiaceae bacterium]